jgi:RNA polymerase II subunit A-like phosphatase
MWARSFGARINVNLTKSTTHVIAHKDRRTSKVRQATQHPHIHIVSITWLLECFSRWQHADEGPHTIELARDSGQQDSLPFDEFEEGITLTPSEDGAESGDLPFDLEDEPPLSPTFELGKLKWDDVDDEVNEFLGSDVESDFDEEGSESDASNGSNRSAKSTTRKRKRAPSSVNGDGEPGAEESDRSASGEPGSELQKRRKKAHERLTGLANVTVPDQSSGLPSPETTGPDDENDKANGVDEDGEDNDDDGDDLERALQEAMESASDDDDDEATA